MDDLHSFLVDEHQPSRISPEWLEQMGTQAANRLLDEGIALNTSIAKLAATAPDVNHEHVKRICEFANNAVYLAKHDQSKTAGASSSYPQFILADPNRIIQDMSDGARPTTVTSVDADYGRQPLKKEKISSDESWDALAELFQVKTAEASPVSRESGVEDVMGLKSTLTGLRDNLTSTGERFDLMRQEAEAEYYDSVKRHLLNGGGFEDVVNAARKAAGDSETVNRLLQPTVVRLIKEKVSSPQALHQAVSRIEKVAHRVLNEKHPFVATFGAMVSMDQEIEKTATALAEIDEALSDVNAVIREQCNGGQAL